MKILGRQWNLLLWASRVSSDILCQNFTAAAFCCLLVSLSSFSLFFLCKWKASFAAISWIGAECMALYTSEFIQLFPWELAAIHVHNTAPTTVFDRWCVRLWIMSSFFKSPHLFLFESYSILIRIRIQMPMDTLCILIFYKITKHID